MIKAFCHYVDATNEWLGKYGGFLVVPLVLLVATEVVMRYLFHSSLPWVWDINIQLLGVIGMLGGGYALLRGAHVAVDAITEHFSLKRRAIVDLITAPVFFIGIGVLLLKTINAACTSVQIREFYVSWLCPPIYPFKIIVSIGVLLVLLQGIVKFIRDIGIVSPGGKP